MCIDIIFGTYSLAPNTPGLSRLKIEDGQEITLIKDIHHQVVASVDKEGVLDIYSVPLTTRVEGNFLPAEWRREGGIWSFSNADNARGLQKMQARVLRPEESDKYKDTPTLTNKPTSP